MDPADTEPETGSGPSNKSRIIWTFADQALSSLANFALSIVVAREVSKNDFASFSLMLVTFTFLIGLGKAMVGDPYVVRFTDADRHTRRRASRQATGAAISFGVLSGVICVIASFFLDDRSAAGILGLGIAMPGLMLQETWRSAFFAEGRPRTATINDGVRTLIQFALLGVLLTSDEPSVLLITLAWGAGGLVAALIGIMQTRVVPDPFEALAWYRETRDINVKMGLDFSFNQGATTLASYVIAGIVGTVAIGAIRASQTLLGPLNLLFSGISSFGLPLLSRTALSGKSLVKHAIMLSVAIGGMASVWVLILLVVPTSIGKQFLGDTWDSARQVMLPMGIVTLTVGFVLGASLGLKALRRADQMLRVTFVQAPLMLGLGAGMGAVWGGQGAAWGFAIAQVTGFVACWTIFVRADRMPRDWTSEEEDDGAPRTPQPRRDDEFERHDGRPFWDQDEQDRWAREEPEQIYGGQQAEERTWAREDHRPDGFAPRPGEQVWPSQGGYDPQEPTVAVRQGTPSEWPAPGGYGPQEPTVAVRQDRDPQAPDAQPKFRAPWENTSEQDYRQAVQGRPGEPDAQNLGDARGRQGAQGFEDARGRQGGQGFGDARGHQGARGFEDAWGYRENGYEENGYDENGYDENGYGDAGYRDAGSTGGGQYAAGQQPVGGQQYSVSRPYPSGPHSGGQPYPGGRPGSGGQPYPDDQQYPDARRRSRQQAPGQQAQHGQQTPGGGYPGFENLTGENGYGDDQYEQYEQGRQGPGRRRPQAQPPQADPWPFPDSQDHQGR
ncbi:hypothetical protein KIH74_00775 [Kineosporia sp. J2-2]|uniref:Membrane protein involved in the export of O-antigen and teichoic acid n=1 Tax=Kineosporia corallincola TaxID=2835133 RepID=A0ABS5T8N9_9ACTN|nr:hypothetical protein [Kineosporia corallincola]MBT0767434.1 hypothetical protein [Kineosporia corallincola]